MPNLNEFFESKIHEVPLDPNIEIIEQMRPCSKCDLFVESYSFNTQTFEMFWTCVDGHETRYRVS
jgi:hypothetical protein